MTSNDVLPYVWDVKSVSYRDELCKEDMISITLNKDKQFERNFPLHSDFRGKIDPTLKSITFLLKNVWNKSDIYIGDVSFMT